MVVGEVREKIDPEISGDHGEKMESDEIAHTEFRIRKKQPDKREGRNRNDRGKQPGRVEQQVVNRLEVRNAGERYAAHHDV